MKQIDGQISINEYISNRDGRFLGCSPCACRSCLYWWSQRCPYGECYDDLRTKDNPYDKAHPGNPPRTAWSNWNKPGEQAHWCRGGTCYPIYYCEQFVKYQGQQVQDCLKAVVSVFQDGYIGCGFIDSMGCQKCYEEFTKKEVLAAGAADRTGEDKNGKDR